MTLSTTGALSLWQLTMSISKTGALSLWQLTIPPFWSNRERPGRILIVICPFALSWLLFALSVAAKTNLPVWIGLRQSIYYRSEKLVEPH